jgi:ABC-type polysaccharide/polyol phosphate export permease
MTPIIYPLNILPLNIQNMLQFNPLVHLVGLFRSLVYEGIVPSLEQWLLSIGIAFGTLIIGWLIFTEKSDEFAYRT